MRTTPTLIIIAAAAGCLFAADLPKLPGPPLKQVELRGRVVCLAEEMERLHDVELPSHHEHVYGLKMSDGRYYTLLRTRNSEAIFTDAEVRAKDLLLKGKIFPHTDLFEAVTLRCVRDGKVYDLVYYCDICHIFTIAPGICECCKGPTTLIERPIE